MLRAGFDDCSELAPTDIGGTQNWFAVYVMPRHEKRVAQLFHVRQIEHFLPLYEVRRKWRDGSWHMVQFPLFPGYLFIRADREKRGSVLAVPGVLWIVGGWAAFSEVSDRYIRFLRDNLAQGKIEPHSDLAVGERVRVKSGAMAGMEGILIRKKGGFRVVVTFELLKRSMAVEIDVSDLESFRSARDSDMEMSPHDKRRESVA